MVAKMPSTVNVDVTTTIAMNTGVLMSNSSSLGTEGKDDVRLVI